MGTAIKFFNEETENIISFGDLYYYKLNSGRIQKRFDIERLINDKQYFLNAHSLGFDKFQKSFSYDYKRCSFYVPISINFIKYHQIKCSRGEDYIVLSKTKLDDVSSFYTFSLEIEIEGIRTVFQRSIAYYNKYIYIETPEKENLKSQMNQIFGEPQNIPELENEKYGSGKRYFFYIVPISRIDKIIGIKKYRDISTIGQLDGEQFTGEIEEIILDLHNFDENIYKIFKEHGMLEIEKY